MKNRNVITKKIEGKVWEEALNKSFEKNVKKVKIDGFREGKCPRNVFEKKYGVESLYNDAVDIVLPSVYSEMLKESKLIPVVQPSIDIKEIDKKSVTLEFVVITAPEVKIKKYKDLKVKKDVVKVTKEEVDKEIERLRDQYAEIEIKDGKAENGDTVVIDFEGFKGKKPFEGGKGENYPLELGSHTFIPGFEEQLIGTKDGDEVDVKVTFPEDYPSEELKGEKVTFKVKVHEVKVRVLPEINEEFFDDLGIDVHSKKDLEAHCKKDLTERKEKEADNKFAEDLLERVAKETKIELPEELVHEEIHHMIDTYSERLKMQGLSFEQYLEFTHKTFDDIEKEIEPEAKKNLTYRYMMEEIAKLENIEPTDKDAEEEVEKLAIEYNMTKEELINAYGGLEMIKYDLKMRNTMDYLKENN